MSRRRTFSTPIHPVQTGCQTTRTNPEPIRSQSCPNLVPIRFQLECQYCQSDANQVPIHCQSDADPVLIRCQTKANLMSMSMHCQSGANRFSNPTSTNCQSANPITILCQSGANPLSIQRRSRATNPIRSQSAANPIPIQCQSSSINSMPIYQSIPICQSITNPPIYCQFWANLPIHHQAVNPSPIIESDAYPGQICKSITDPPIRCQSSTNLSI